MEEDRISELQSRYWSHSSREAGSWRWWLHNRRRGEPILSAEVSWRARLTGLSLTRDDDGAWSTSIMLYWLFLCLKWRTPWAKYRPERRSLSLSFHDGAAFWRVWKDDMSWSRGTPRWRDGSFNFVDFVLGKSECSTVVLDEKHVLVPMPEKSYPATAKLVEFTWKRSRSPFTKRMIRADIDIPGGIPVPGKGENSWDCGDDATYSITTGEVRSIAEGVGKLVGSCLETRVKRSGYLGWSWRKEPTSIAQDCTAALSDKKEHRMTNTPGDGTLAWYLHDNMSKPLTPALCQEISRRSSSPGKSADVEPAPPKRVWGSEQEVFDDLLARVTSDPDTVKLWLDPISWHFPVKNGRIDHDATATAGSLMDLGRSVRNYYGMWDAACPFTEVDSDRLKIEDGIIVDEKHPDNVSDRIIKKVLAVLMVKGGA